jgi:hypothetical protein
MTAWDRLLAEPDWCRGAGRFPLPAYSEFMPPPWVGPKPYDGGPARPGPRAGDWGWDVSESEQEQELRPGLEWIARHALAEVIRLGRGLHTPHLARDCLRDNPYWPRALAEQAGKLAHERYLLLLSVSLSRTQDDKGRVRWTLFGSSEQGPGRPFWRSFFTAPGKEAPAEEAWDFLADLLARVYQVPERTARDPRNPSALAGLRVLPAGADPDFPFWDEGPLPSWCGPLLWQEGADLGKVRFLLTFRPFECLPAEVQNAYVGGRLHLLPFPGSLAFWGDPSLRRLQRQLPLAMQVPLLHLFPRHRGIDGIRIPQSGRLHEGMEAPEGSGTHRPEFVRTHRWQKVARHEDETALCTQGDRVTHVLFSTEPDDLGLYGKPMARNVQVWDSQFRLLLDGPRQGPAEIGQAEEALARGGMFGYRFLFPAMRVGPWEVYWQRPVAAFPGGRLDEPSPHPVLLPYAPTGYLTAYRADAPDLAAPIELWPRLLRRPVHQAANELFAHESQPRRHATTANVRALLEWHELLGQPLPRPLARALLGIPRRQTLDGWLTSLAGKASDPVAGKALAERLVGVLSTEENTPAEEGLTFSHTATREFEVAYWATIAELAHGEYRTKCNADCVRDKATRAALDRHRRDLDALGRHLMERHARAIREAGLNGQAWVGEQAFHWRTDFEFDWWGGWAGNQKGTLHERNVVVRIPGRDSTQAVIMADHYDTAYMEDCYDPKRGGTGARLAAAGADDDHSATAALLLACPTFLELSKAGRLGCDVWLVHLTGEEFPSDCLGARHLCQALVEGTLRVKQLRGPTHDLSGARVRGAYVSDMIAHNRHHRNVFQIAPGEGRASAELARQAWQANRAWNALAGSLNRKAPRRGAAPYRRSDEAVPALTRHAHLHGEVRPDWEPRSTLYNTDGQIFSDAGVPVVLFMEDYDINRSGYHDSQDTLANIDLDYGAALAAIVIESVARVACRP